MKSLKARALVYGLVILLGLLAALPNLLPAQAVAILPAWYTSTTISLGLDLQGGSHLLLAADTAELFDAETRAIAEELGPKLVAAGVTGVRPKAESGAVVVMAKKPEQLQAAATVGIAGGSAATSAEPLSQNNMSLKLASWRKALCRHATLIVALL